MRGAITWQREKRLMPSEWRWGGGGGVGGGTWVNFVGYVPLVSQSLYPIIVYSVGNYKPHLSHFWANT